MHKGYVIFALPRSRTAWLSHFLTYGDWSCGHDEIRHMRSMSDIRMWFNQPCNGTIETAAAPFWRLLEDISDCKVITVRRPVADVVDSMMRIPGCSFDRESLTKLMEKYDRKLDQIEARIPGVMSVDYADLSDEAVCAKLFEHCLPYPHDGERWAALSKINIQINMPALIRYCDAYATALSKLASVARHKCLTKLAVVPANPESMSIQTESFDQWLADAPPLLREHHFQIGESPDNWQNKNIPLLRALDEIGAMQITTARSNGRMFGYLITLLSPSLVTEDMMTGVNTAFFADPNAPGVGMKIQRAALAMLKEKGVGEVFWETNTVGGAERIGSIYRRLGAEEKGSVYRLRLKEAA